MCPRLLALAVCTLLFMVGCDKSESVDSKGGISAKTDSSEPQTTVKLLESGAEPRTVLRYKFQANRTERMVMETIMAMAMEIGDQIRPERQLPSTRMTMAIDSKEVSPEGELHYEFTLEKTEVVPNPGDNPAAINAMQRQLATMLGLRGSATVTSRGFCTDVKINIPGGASPQVRRMIDDMKQSMTQMLAPLPVEPVGKGARWQVTTPIETPTTKLTQTTTYTLSEIQGDQVKFDVQIKQSAPPQESRLPGAAPGVTVMLESLTTSGSGTIERQMQDVVATSNLNVTTTNVISSDQRVKTTMRIWAMINPLP